jgi:formate-dependent nitrite reductase cytochrome c552 subunit
MKKLLIATITLLSTIQVVNAEEKYSHFPSLQSADIHTAMCNIKNYNTKLAAITSKAELTTEDMVKVHELTYTLENAVNFLKVSLEQVSADLEDVHKASERLDQKIIKNSGKKYLDPTNKILEVSKC